MAPAVGPVEESDRIELLDIVRGFALFGVLLANLMWTASALGLTEAASAALSTAAIDPLFEGLWICFVYDKANTLFSFLFGLGFAIQLERGERRGDRDFSWRFTRRLAVLFCFGLLHNFLLWFGDILHLYALTGLFLLPARRLSNRALWTIGLLLALCARPLYDAVPSTFPAVSEYLESIPSPYSAESVERRHTQLVDGRYRDVLAVNLDMTRTDWVMNGTLLAWIFYALGRFLLGFWVGRKGYLERAERWSAGWAKLLRLSLPAGLLLNGWRTAIWAFQLELRGFAELVSNLLIQVGTLALAASYLAALVLLYLGSARWRRRLELLAPPGRMALTNYLGQSLLYLFVLYGLGLGWLGQIGPSVLWALAISFFAAQVAFSAWWLRRFHFGPVEWLWRTSSYGRRPPMLR